ncbi:MAG: hypothetical protein DMF85_15820, partial [Acidobacteria bacterium]
MIRPASPAVVALCLSLTLASACGRPAAPATFPAAPRFYQPPSAPLPPSAERAYRAVAPLVDGDTAMEIVRFMDQYWRIAGNPGFNASIDRIR